MIKLDRGNSSITFKHFALRLSGTLLWLLIWMCAPVRTAQTTESESAGGPDAEVRDFEIGRLEARLKTMPQGTERDYFLGVLANRDGQLAKSIRLLERVLPKLRSSRPDRAAIALEALADDYAKSFRYDDAARVYDDLVANFATQLTQQSLKGTNDDAGVTHLLRGEPPQIIAWEGPTRLKTERNVLNSLVTKISVNGVQEDWLLDTGANFSAVNKSFAERIGLKPLPGYAQTMAGITGIENPLQVAIMPTLRLGGATLHDVVVLILDDASLRVELEKQSYQINAIIGYAVFQALGTITFLHDGSFAAGESAQPSEGGARKYMKLLAPVIECAVKGKVLPFSFDTGATRTNLSLRYFQRFKDDSSSWEKGENESSGAGGMVKRDIYLQPQLNLRVGNKTATLKNVPIFLTPMGSSLDELNGNLGQDFVPGFASFTLDFSKMTFSLGGPLPEQPTN